MQYTSRSVLFLPLNYEDELFALDVLRGKNKTSICMKLFIPVVNTRMIPTVYSVLKIILPSILLSTCFNEENLPFSQEVRQTEIGHLFEHILLEYLCQCRLSHGANSAVYSGNTSWNWHKESWGTFHITITSGVKDQEIFEEALVKTIQLTKFLLQGIPVAKGVYPSFQSFPVALKNGTASTQQ